MQFFEGKLGKQEDYPLLLPLGYEISEEAGGEHTMENPAVSKSDREKSTAAWHQFALVARR